MRALLAVPPSTARLHNLVPLGWALRTGSSEVQIAGRTSFAATVNGTGFVAVECGDADTPTLGEPSDVDGLVDYARRWRPDVVLYDAAAPAGAEAAAAVGAAAVRVFGPCDPATPDARATDLDTVPPSLRTDPVARAVRFTPYSGAAEIPAWSRRKPRRARVYAQLGSLPAADLRAVLAAFAAARGAEFVCALPFDRVPRDVALASHVRLFDTVPLTAILSSCAAVVHDGDGALALAAAAAGLPQFAVCPDGAGIAGRVAGYGAGMLGGEPGAGVGAVLDEKPLRAKAESLGAEIAALPVPREIAAAIVGPVAGD